MIQSTLSCVCGIKKCHPVLFLHVICDDSSDQKYKCLSCFSQPSPCFATVTVDPVQHLIDDLTGEQYYQSEGLDMIVIFR